MLTLLAPCLMNAEAATPKAAASKAAASKATAPKPITLPDYSGQSILIKNTVAAVNHGNLTGNYTVLRDLSSPRFRQRHSASDLANTFSPLRKQKLDLSPILVTAPQLSRAPAKDQRSRRMQLVGFFPTHPNAVQFNLIFQHFNGGWVIDEVSVGLVPTKSVVPARPAKRHSLPTPRTRR